MKYSVVVRTKNSEKTLEKCLRSLLAQSIKPQQIVVVDSGSDDQTVTIAKKLGTFVVNYPANEPFNYSRALNLGISYSKDDHILLLSSHVIITDLHTVELMFGCIQDKNCIAVSVVRSSKENSSTISSPAEVVQKKICLENFKGQAMYNFCSFFRKESWMEYNFNEKIPRCEDQDWSYFFLNKGYHTKIILNPKIFYDNPYYNSKKDAWDYITIGAHFYPYFLSYFHLWKLLQKAVTLFLKGEEAEGKHHLFVVLRLLKHKAVPSKKLTSVYHKDLG